MDGTSLQAQIARSLLLTRHPVSLQTAKSKMESAGELTASTLGGQQWLVAQCSCAGLIICFKSCS